MLVCWDDFGSVSFPFIVGYFLRICRKRTNEVMAYKHGVHNVKIVASYVNMPNFLFCHFLSCQVDYMYECIKLF